MVGVAFSEEFELRMAALDASIGALNLEKAKLLLGSLGLPYSAAQIDVLLDSPNVVFSVPHAGMCRQLNAYCKTVEQLQFVVDYEQPIFTLREPKAVSKD